MELEKRISPEKWWREEARKILEELGENPGEWREELEANARTLEIVEPPSWEEIKENWENFLKTGELPEDSLGKMEFFFIPLSILLVATGKDPLTGEPLSDLGKEVIQAIKQISGGLPFSRREIAETYLILKFLKGLGHPVDSLLKTAETLVVETSKAEG